MTATHDDPTANKLCFSFFSYLLYMLYMHKYILVHVLPYTFQQISLQKNYFVHCVIPLHYTCKILYHTYLYWQYELAMNFSLILIFKFIFRMKKLPKRIKICNSSWPTCLAHSLEDTPTTMHSLLHFYHNPTSCIGIVTEKGGVLPNNQQWLWGRGE